MTQEAPFSYLLAVFDDVHKLTMTLAKVDFRHPSNIWTGKITTFAVYGLSA